MKHTAPLIKNGWMRALLFFVSWILLLIPLGAFLKGLIAKIDPANPYDIKSLAIGAVVSTLISVLLVIAYRKWVDRKNFVSLGLQWKGMKDYAIAGFCWGLLLLCLCSLVLMAGEWLRFVGVSFNAPAFGAYLLIMMLVSFSEELVWRGYFLLNLLHSFKPIPSLLISAGVFALLHASNPSVNALSLIGVFSGGLLLGVNYIFTRNLWFGFMLHFSWNFIQGPVMGFSVSGIPVQSVLEQQTNGPLWLTGGVFGIEASALMVIFNVSTTVLLIFFYKNKATEKI